MASQSPTFISSAIVGLMLWSTLAVASENCTKEQYEIDKARIQAAFSAGTLANGPKDALQREYILVDERTWFAMNYLRQIAFMQSFECSLAGGSKKQLLYMDVRSLATGNLLATWTLGVLKPTQESQGITNPPAQESHGVTNPGMPEVMEEETRIGLTGEGRAAFINNAIDACNKRGESAPPTDCSCYANAMADSVSIEELKEITVPGTQEAGMIALRPKMDAAAKRCLRN
jgi:hypothetical protein